MRHTRWLLQRTPLFCAYYFTAQYLNASFQKSYTTNVHCLVTFSECWVQNVAILQAAKCHAGRDSHHSVFRHCTARGVAALMKVFRLNGENLLHCLPLTVYVCVCLCAWVSIYVCLSVLTRTSCSIGWCVLRRRRESSLRRQLSPSRQLESSSPIRPTLSIRM